MYVLEVKENQVFPFHCGTLSYRYFLGRAILRVIVTKCITVDIYLFTFSSRKANNDGDPPWNNSLDHRRDINCEPDVKFNYRNWIFSLIHCAD